jgi:hypothetical protein
VKLFTHAIVIGSLRPDQTFCAQINILEAFQERFFFEYPNISMDDIVISAGIGSLAIFLLSIGSYPTLLVEETAQKSKKNLNSVSMGQGREKFGDGYIAQSTATVESVFFRVAI